jgi:hypothetical protein
MLRASAPGALRAADAGPRRPAWRLHAPQTCMVHLGGEQQLAPPQAPAPPCRRQGARLAECSRAAAAAAQGHPLQEGAPRDEQLVLSNLLAWLVANGERTCSTSRTALASPGSPQLPRPPPPATIAGVQGVGQEGSPVALYQGEGGERGLLACAVRLCAGQACP